MQQITSSIELKNAIQLLEAEHAVKQEFLKEQFYITYESLKPVNLVRRTINEISSSPEIIDNLIGTSMGMASGYISKKLFVGSSDSKFRKLFGMLVQYGIATAVRRNSEGIRSFILQALKHFENSTRDHNSTFNNSH